MSRKTDKTDIVAWLKKGSRAIYAAVEAEAAKDISEGMKIAAARIAELEAERDRHKANAERLYASLNDLSVNARPALDRIAELEAALLAEREACAKLAESYTAIHPLGAGIATAIRARPAP